MCVQILAHHTGKTSEQVVEDSERDLFMDPETARQYGPLGLIDKVTPIPQKSVGTPG